MGDSFQTIAFDTVKSADAEAVAKRAIEWLQHQRYIKSTRHVPDQYESEGESYEPGPNWHDIIDDTRRWPGLVRASDFDHAPPPGYVSSADIGFPNINPNTVEPRVGRSVCDCGENWSEFERGVCPACGKNVDPGIDISELCGQWFEGEDSTMTCSSCGVASRLEEWDLQPYWAFANVHITFWNWPTLSLAFVNDIAAAIGVPHARHIIGKY